MDNGEGEEPRAGAWDGDGDRGKNDESGFDLFFFFDFFGANSASSMLTSLSGVVEVVVSSFCFAFFFVFGFSFAGDAFFFGDAFFAAVVTLVAFVADVVVIASVAVVSIASGTVVTVSPIMTVLVAWDLLFFVLELFLFARSRASSISCMMISRSAGPGISLLSSPSLVTVERRFLFFFGVDSLDEVGAGG